MKWLFLLLGLFEQTISFSQADSLLDKHNVVWTTSGPSSSESRPPGNGDIGINVWVQPGGDLAMLISKTDAWSENNHSPRDL